MIAKYKLVFLCLFLLACGGTKYEIKRDISSFKPQQKKQNTAIHSPKIFQEITVEKSDYYTVDINILIDDIITKPKDEGQH